MKSQEKVLIRSLGGIVHVDCDEEEKRVGIYCDSHNISVKL